MTMFSMDRRQGRYLYNYAVQHSVQREKTLTTILPLLCGFFRVQDHAVCFYPTR